MRVGIVKFLTSPFAGANAVPWPANTVDSVTNALADLNSPECAGGPYTCYSNIFGLVSAEAPSGPYRPFESYEFGIDETPTGGWLFDTYMPDGKTDAGDATMPEFRVDFQILPNGSEKGMKKGVNAIDGAGELEAVEKLLRHTFDKNGDKILPTGGEDGEEGQPEELTSPFYTREIPAIDEDAGVAAPDNDAEEYGIGTTRSRFNNNAAGYLEPELGSLRPYLLWDFAREWTIDPQRGGTTNCAEVLDDDTGPENEPAQTPDNTPKWREKPEGTDLAATYVDEHGESQAQLTPDDDFYFDNLGVKPNSQGGCDLQGIDVLGTSTVIATAYYPDQQPFGYKQVSSNSVKQSWFNGYNAQLSFAPKGVNAPGHRVTVWFSDITGNAPESGDGSDTQDIDVCLSAPGGGVTVPTLFSSFNNEQFPQEDNRGVDGITEGPSLKCTEMQQQPGQKVLTGYFDVVGPLPLTVYALFDEIQIKRSITIAKKGASGGNLPPVQGDGKPIKPSTLPKKGNVTTPTNAQLKGAGLLVKKRIAKVKRVKYKKVKARGKIKRGKVFVKVQSPTTKAKIKLTAWGFNKKGSWVKLRTYKRVVKANKKKFVVAKIIKPARLAKRVRRVDATVLRTMGRPIA